MKKYLYLAALALIVASCDNRDYTEDWAQPQHNDQGEVIAPVLTLTETELIDFNTIEEDVRVKLFNADISEPNVLVTYAATLFNDDKSRSYGIEVDNDGMASASDLKSAVEYLYNKMSEQRDMPLEVVANINFGATDVALGPITVEKKGETVVHALLTETSFGWQYIWIAGNGNGWGSPADPMATVNYDGVYEGMAYIDGAFKFRSQESNWDAPDWGQGASLGTLAEGAGDINKESEFASGFYMLKADLAAMTYEAVAVNSITMVGTHNGWNQADEATHMTYDVAQKCWTIDYTFTDDAMVKFAMNDSWDISWGGADGDASNYCNLTCDSGKDLNVAAGTYHVKLYLKCEGKNYVEFVPGN
ncbi:MAG: hypothetical protein IJ844_00745 [Prevotella sp.]|nr:hypothetical protein [Prevotella sp.]